MEKVIPQGLNYADIKPELIENRVKLVQFRPHSSATNATPGQTIRFDIKSNGFYDPYSAYFKFTIAIPTERLDQNYAKCLDRSAHSLIKRFIVRSNGTELERIEDYDIVAAMINDVIYSNEQKQLHHFEGFPHLNIVPQHVNDGGMVDAPMGYNGPGNVVTQCGDVGYYQFGVKKGGSAVDVGQAAHIILNAADRKLAMTRVVAPAADYKLAIPDALTANLIDLELDYEPINGSNPTSIVRHLDPYGRIGASQQRAGITLTNAYGAAGAQGAADAATVYNITGADGEKVQVYPQVSAFSANVEFTFCIPIYSGIIGVLMHDKKLLPLSLLPLEIEIQLNPYFLYTSQTSADTRIGRGYFLKDINLYSHILEFEQEVHRSLEAVVVQHGIFIHYPSFFQAPITTSKGTLAATHNINIYAKSINSVHGVFLDKEYEVNANRRRLDFIAPPLRNIQIRNGTEYIPSLPIEGHIPSATGLHSQFLIETYKAWNKMHDPSTDSALACHTYQQLVQTDYGGLTSLQQLYLRQGNLGRFQWGISFEGEELGRDKDTIAGRRGLMPFDVAFLAGRFADETAFYEAHIFARADYFLYVRPDLVVTVLGK